MDQKEVLGLVLCFRMPSAVLERFGDKLCLVD